MLILLKCIPINSEIRNTDNFPVCVYLSIWVCMSIYVYVCIYVCVCICVYTRTHTKLQCHGCELVLVFSWMLTNTVIPPHVLTLENQSIFTCWLLFPTAKIKFLTV